MNADEETGGEEAARGPMFTLPPPGAVVGRKRACDVTVPDRKCSKFHCRIDCREGVWRIHDLESQNGTFVNEERVTVRDLAPGDAVRVGFTVFSFCAPEAAGGPASLVFLKRVKPAPGGADASVETDDPEEAEVLSGDGTGSAPEACPGGSGSGAGTNALPAEEAALAEAGSGWIEVGTGRPLAVDDAESFEGPTPPVGTPVPPPAEAAPPVRGAPLPTDRAPRPASGEVAGGQPEEPAVFPATSLALVIVLLGVAGVVFFAVGGGWNLLTSSPAPGTSEPEPQAPAGGTPRSEPPVDDDVRWKEMEAALQQLLQRDEATPLREELRSLRASLRENAEKAEAEKRSLRREIGLLAARVEDLSARLDRPAEKEAPAPDEEEALSPEEKLFREIMNALEEEE